MSRPGHPTSLTVARSIEVLRNALFTEYGVDYAFSVLGNGYLLATSDAAHGVIEAVTSGPERTEPLSSYPAWLTETVLSMEHSHSPAIRIYGDHLRHCMEGK